TSAAFGDQALRMKVRNAVDESLSEQEIEGCDEMHNQRRTAGKKHGIRPSNSWECCGEQQQVRDHRPDQPRHEFVFLVGVAMDANDLQRAIAYCFRELSAR